MTEKTPPSDDYLGPDRPCESQNESQNKARRPIESQHDETRTAQGMETLQRSHSSPHDAFHDAPIVIAEVVQDGPQKANAIIQAEPVTTKQIAGNDDINSCTSSTTSPPVATFPLAAAENFDRYRLQLKGGAVGGVLLGGLSIVGAFLTGYSTINAVMGFALSLSGLGSSSPRLAFVGVVLSVVGVVLSSVLAVNR